MTGKYTITIALLGTLLPGPAVAAGLSGKLIFVSAGHGWIDYGTGWATQRGIWNDLVEDYVGAEAVSQYLIPYLENAGAQVLTVRERDMASDMVIIDSADLDLFPANGQYFESGDPSAVSDSGLASFENFRAPYTSTENPLVVAGNEDRLVSTAATETARGTWVPALPKAGFYTVYVSYSSDPGRVADAHYIVKRPGGETHVRIDQKRRGSTWRPLGRFWFDSGYDPSTGAVVLANDSATVGGTVSADAVRFGGGMGDILGENSAVVSGRPRWDEGARTFTQYLGAPASVWGAGSPGSDGSSRSRYAAWANEAGVDDSVYVSWHSNASTYGSARGTVSFVYSANLGPYDPSQSVAGSPELMTGVHDEIINDIRNAWDASWTDRGYNSAPFSELNPIHNPEMPSAWFEIAFHDNTDDAAQLAEPRFRQLVARAVYQGIVKYFANRDTVPVHFLPEPPLAVEAHGSGPGQITVSWEASPVDSDGVRGDAADSYRVYLSRGGKSFDGGRLAAGTSLMISDLEPGGLYFVRVTGVNAGGESLPSETLAATAAGFGARRILIVSGFDRLDQYMLVPEFAPSLGTTRRMFLEQMNTFDYTLEHSQAVLPLGVGIDSSANEAVSSGRVDLTGWPAVLWLTGEESTADETLSALEQSRLQPYLDAGGRLFISGAELGWDLDHQGGPADRAFYEGTLGCDYTADDAGVYVADGDSGSILAGLSNVTFDNGMHGNYDVTYPDVVAAIGDAERCMTYDNMIGGACVEQDAGAYRTVTFGFPFEAIYPAQSRAQVMERVLDFLVDLSVCPALLELSDLVLDDTRFFRAATAITLERVQVLAGGDVTFEAGDSITLLDGVAFEAGATVRLVLDPAPDCN